MLVLGVTAVMGVFAFMFVCMCGGMVVLTAPNPQLAELDIEPGVEFVLPVETSLETARDVYLEFDVEYPIDPNTTEIAEPWAAAGWVELDGMEFEIDLKPGSEGVVGHPSDWEKGSTASYAWGEASGELLLGSVPPGTAEGQTSDVKGMIWGEPGTYLVATRVYVRE